ncbi:MAG: hypothetical protein E7813_25765 [Bradyrhizobium sp.]|uniref:hypothetical protein n=1 Tax=Bradyrhizobium sp. TaxID=376 RepID=UPI00121A702F|nr:hypothetical protein [Bradyrhizobium sp.]THD58766.1 MAG: hypothetical protein E7813_25765 [Bradyrhizobium sp.]
MAKASDDLSVFDVVSDVIDDVRNQLRIGEARQGITLTLTADECTKMLACLKDPPLAHRKPKNGIEKAQKTVAIALHCFGLKKGGMLMKNAVEDTAEHFGCKRSTVYTACKRHPPSK